MKSQVVKKKVYVGLSGGVDSAVSAALLKKEGYEVTGVFIKAWTPPFDSAQGTRKITCEWREDRRSAMRAAAVLDIPFITLDLEKEYKKEVVDYMIREYKEGKTPNPDVMCNKEIKFGHFLNFALANGADFVATGHYAQTSPPASLVGKLDVVAAPLSLVRRGGTGGEVVLREGTDKNKDQSYFLWTLTKDQLKHVLFPVGSLQKQEVRRLAEKFGLPQATRKDSQGLCFLGKIDMKEFLKEYLETKKGKVLLAPHSLGGVGDEVGEIIGEHEGAALYTLGERHGFSVKNHSADNAPMYVVAKDIKNNTITVSNKMMQIERSFNLHTKEIQLKNVNKIGQIKNNRKIECRFRYRQTKVPCKISGDKVTFDIPQLIAPGQSLVFYAGEQCLGGGVIS